MFRHVNGRGSTPPGIPADKPLTERIHRPCAMALAEAAVGHRHQQSRAVSLALTRPGSPICTASSPWTRRRSGAGSDPVLPLLTAIDSVETLRPRRGCWAALTARQAVAGLVALQAEPDPGDPNRYDVCRAGRVGLPDEEYYRGDRVRRDPRASILAHLAGSLELADRGSRGRKAQQRSLSSRPAIAATHWDKVRAVISA